MFASIGLPVIAMGLFGGCAAELNTRPGETLLGKVKAECGRVVFAAIEAGSRAASSLGEGEGRTCVGSGRVWPLCMCDKTLASCGEVELDSGCPCACRVC